MGVIALQSGILCGVAALKRESIASHAHLSPWAAAGFVHPSVRRQGIGALLLAALEHQARELGFRRIHCGTSSAQALLEACADALRRRVRRTRPQPVRLHQLCAGRAVEGVRLHTLDGSWNELWTGTRQTRLLSFEDEHLIYTTPETVDPMDGRLCTYRVEFERARAGKED